MHVWTQIREHIAGTALATVAPLTTAGEVYRSRARRVTGEKFVNVYTVRDTITIENPGRVGSPKREQHLLQVAIDVAVASNSDADEQLDALCVAIQGGMAADQTLGGKVQYTDFTNTVFGRSGEGEKTFQTARLLYGVQFRTLATDPETFL